MYYKKLLSMFLVVTIVFSAIPSPAFAESSEKTSSIWSQISDKASSVTDSVSDIANSVLETAKDAISNMSLPNFKEGWELSSSFFGTTVSAIGGQQYVTAVADSINNLQANITLRANSVGSSIASKAGFVAEEWHSGTYNIDAIAKGIKKTAETGKSNAFGSADVSVGGELDAGLKYYATAEKSVKAQARITQDAQNLIEKYNEYILRTNDTIPFEDWLSKSKISLDDYSDLYWEAYGEQMRIIPSDQLDDARAFLKNAIEKESAKNTPNRQAVAQSYKDTLKDLSDRLETSDGTSSIPLTKKEAEAIAKAGIDNEFKPSDFGVETSSVIKGNYVAQQAIKAGITSAAIETAIVLGPQIYEIIKYLIETGSIDSEQIKAMGIDGLSAAADGYLKGSISNALVILCQAGKLGAEYTAASPEFIGAMTVLVIDAVKYGFKMANGEISTAQYADIMAQELIVSAAALGSASAVALLFPQATLAICVGSFVGSLIASAGYPAGKQMVLAVISNSDIQILVPIQSSAASLRDKAYFLTSNLSDSLSGIKTLNISDIKDKTIAVFDFTN